VAKSPYEMSPKGKGGQEIPTLLNPLHMEAATDLILPVSKSKF